VVLVAQPMRLYLHTSNRVRTVLFCPSFSCASRVDYQHGPALGGLREAEDQVDGFYCMSSSRLIFLRLIAVAKSQTAPPPKITLSFSRRLFLRCQFYVDKAKHAMGNAMKMCSPPAIVTCGASLPDTVPSCAQSTGLCRPVQPTS
jgi:hypothetical protein